MDLKTHKESCDAIIANLRTIAVTAEEKKKLNIVLEVMETAMSILHGFEEAANADVKDRKEAYEKAYINTLHHITKHAEVGFGPYPPFEQVGTSKE